MPLTAIAPALDFSRSAMTLKSVVLPQPDGPMSETKSPSFTVRLTSESAKTGPSAVSKVRLRLRASITAAAAIQPPQVLLLSRLLRHCPAKCVHFADEDKALKGKLCALDHLIKNYDDAP